MSSMKRKSSRKSLYAVSAAVIILVGIAILCKWWFRDPNPPDYFQYIHSYEDCVQVLNHPDSFNGRAFPKHSGLYNESSCHLEIYGVTEYYEINKPR